MRHCTLIQQGYPQLGQHCSTSSLPFTGLNLAVVAVIALLILASGIALRRANKKR